MLVNYFKSRYQAHTFVQQKKLVGGNDDKGKLLMHAGRVQWEVLVNTFL